MSPLVTTSDQHRCTAVILTVDQRDRTLRCLESLFEPQGVDLDVLVWDNGSRDGTAEAVRATFPHVHVHVEPRNLGVASGRNAAAEQAIDLFSPTHLLFLDNDLILTPGFAGALLEPFGQDPSLAQTQAKLRFADGTERLNDGGGCRIQFWLARTTPVGFGEVDRGQCDERRECIAGGGAMMVRVDVFQALGGFDGSFDPVGPEDLDFSLRCYRAGYHALYVPTALAYHNPSHTRPRGYSVLTRIRQWFVFCQRHASLFQRVGFGLFGMPLLLLRSAVSSARRFAGDA